MIKSLILAISISTVSFEVSAATEFENFEVNDELKYRASLIDDLEIERNDVEGVSKNLKRALRSTNVVKTTLIPLDDEKKLDEAGVSPIYVKVLNLLNNSYKKIGEEQSKGIINRNKSFDLGVLNHSGFTWQKPFGNFSLIVNRQLAPDLFDDNRFIVSDTFTVEIDATTFLSNLKERGFIDISKKTLGAYAGVKFYREYKYVHFADSFEEGLQADYTKLFLTFTNFYGTNFLHMNDYEFMTKRDYITGKIGGGAFIPVAENIRFTAGVMASRSLVSTIEVQRLGDEDEKENGEIFRINFEKNKIAETAIEASLQGDFLKLLRLTLFSYEFEYQYSDAHKIYLSLYESDLKDLKIGTPLQREILNLFNLRKVDEFVLNDYIVSSERRIEENKKSHFKLLFFGKLKKGNVEQVTVNKNGEVKTFFVSRYENIKYVKSLLTSVINGISRFLANKELTHAYKSSRARELEIEYEGKYELTHRDNIRVKEDQFTLSIDHEFNAQKTSGFFNKKYKQYAAHFVENFTNLNDAIIDQINNEQLVGPLSVQVSSSVNRDGIRHFNSIPVKDFSRLTQDICKYHPVRKRFLFFRYVTNPNPQGRTCYQYTMQKYQAYKNAYGRDRSMSLWKLREMLITINKYSDNKYDMTRLFGLGNVFTNGKIKAYTNDQIEFLSHFKEGKLKTLGLIEDYRQESSTVRAPASIEVE